MAVHIGSMLFFRCIPFVSMKNVDSLEEEDFAFLLLAKEEIGLKTRGTNQTNNQTNKLRTCSKHSTYYEKVISFVLLFHEDSNI